VAFSGFHKSWGMRQKLNSKLSVFPGGVSKGIWQAGCIKNNNG